MGLAVHYTFAARDSKNSMKGSILGRDRPEGSGRDAYAIRPAESKYRAIRPIILVRSLRSIVQNRQLTDKLLLCFRDIGRPVAGGQWDRSA